MKLGRYEIGYWFVMMAILTVSALAMAQTKNLVPEVPQWAVIITFAVFFLGGSRLYSTSYLRHIRDNPLAQWMNSRGFSSRVRGNWSPTLQIQGTYLKRQFHTGSVADQAFNDRFFVRPASHKIFSDATLRDRLVQIQTKLDVVDLVKIKKGKLSLYNNEILTDGEKLDGALEAIWLIAEKLDPLR